MRQLKPKYSARFKFLVFSRLLKVRKCIFIIFYHHILADILIKKSTKKSSVAVAYGTICEGTNTL